MMLLRLSLLSLIFVATSAQNDSSRDALFAGIQRGVVADVERLLKSGVSANAFSADGTPALMAATLFGDARMVDLLLEHRADPNQAGAAGTTALMWAVPDIAKVRLLLTRGVNVNAQSETGRTALLVAASYPGTIELLRLLLDRGADLRAQDRGGATALSLAVRSGDSEVVRFLVDQGLDPNALNLAAQGTAFARHDLPTVDYLMTTIAKPIPQLLITAAIWQPVAFVRSWIDSGADVNASLPAVQYSKTPLLSAITSEDEGADTLRLLLEHGADPN